MIEGSAVDKIASFAVHIDSRAIPSKAFHIAKNAILDCVGVTIAGAREPGAQILTRHIKAMEAKGDAGIIGAAFKTAADLAAWANGCAAHALDYDDTFPNSSGYNFHPTAPILPAILALAEGKQASGQDVLTAYVCGVEVEFCLGAAIGRSCSEAGWHPTAILGLMGAVVASARMLKLDLFQTKMAIGIAGSMAGGLMRNSGSMTKPLHAANAARNGVLAALLAERGYTSNENILDGKQSFGELYGGRGTLPLAEAMESLGQDWSLLSKGIALKPYPCCRGAHPSIDAALFLRRSGRMVPEQIESLTCRTAPRIAEILAFNRPGTGSEAKFSLQYCVAKSLTKGPLRMEDFTDEQVRGPAIEALISKVKYEHPKGWPGGADLTQEVIISLKGGTRYSKKVNIPRGEPENPMTEVELADKFKNCTENQIGDLRTAQLLQMLLHLDRLPRVADLTNLIVFNRSEPHASKDSYFPNS